MTRITIDLTEENEGREEEEGRNVEDNTKKRKLALT
jgi:hypothetical protein